MTQQDELLKKVSTLSPEVQKDVYNALKTGYYGAVISKAKAQGGDYKKARLYLDQFFNTAEGKRFGTTQASMQQRARELGFDSVAEFEQVQGFAGTPTKPDIPDQPSGTYIDPSGQGMSISQEELKAGIEEGSIEAGGIYRATSGTSYEVSRDATIKRLSVEEQLEAKAEQVRKEREFTEEERQRRQEIVSAEAERMRRSDFRRSDFLVTPTEPFPEDTPEFFKRVPNVQSSVARTLVTTSSIIGSKLYLDKVPLLNMPTSRGPTEQVIADVTTFGLFSPAMATTTQIAKAVRPTKVIFKGTAQQVKGGKIITDVRFVTTKGATTKIGGKPIIESKGIARGITKATQEGRVTISDTIVRGVTDVKRGVIFPTAKEIVKPTTAFVSRQRGVTKEIEAKIITKMDKLSISQPQKLVASLDFGKTITKKGLRKTQDIFIGKSIGIQGKTGILLGRGQTISKEGGRIESIGIIGKVKTKPRVKGISTGNLKTASVKSFSPDLKSIGLKQTKESISKAIKITPAQTPISKAVMISSPKIKGTTKTTTSISPLQISRTRQTQQIKLTPRQEVRTKQRVKTKLAQKQITIPTTKLKERQLQRQAFRISLKKPTEQKTTKGFTPRISRPPTPPKTPAFFTFQTKPRKTISYPRATYGVGIGKGKIGGFKTIGTGLSLGKAITIGARRTRKTPATKFKIIPQTRGLSIGSVRTPKGFKRKRNLIFVEGVK